MPNDAFAPRKRPDLHLDRSTWLLRKALELTNGPDDNDELAEVVKLLHATLPDTLETAGRWLAEVDSDPMARWAVVYVLGQLNDEAALDLLEREALRQLPERKKQPGVCETPLDAEELVVIMAIETLGTLARAGVGAATDVLLRVVEQQDRRSLRRPAVSALLAVDPVMHDRVMGLLPQHEHHLLSLREALESDVTVEVDKRNEKRRPSRVVQPKPKHRRTVSLRPIRPPRERML